MPNPKNPLLNSLQRDEFMEWLEILADHGDIAGQTGGSSTGFDPIERFLQQTFGWSGRTQRFEYVRETGSKRMTYRLPGWAVEFLALIDKEPIDHEEDGVTTLIGAERCLELLSSVP